MCWAAFTLVGPKVMAGVEPLRATTCATCAGAVLLGLLAAPDLPKVHWGALPTGSAKPIEGGEGPGGDQAWPVTRPMPEEAPVTKATRPVKS